MRAIRLFLSFLFLAAACFAQSNVLQPSDIYRLRSAGDAALSPDGARLAYVVNSNPADPNAADSELMVMTVSGIFIAPVTVPPNKCKAV